MATSCVTTSSPRVESAVNYRALPLRALIGQIIALDGDRSALHEFHDRRAIFEVARGRRVAFGDWLAIQSKSLYEKGWRSGKESKLLDEACDLLVDRFHNIPSDSAALTEDAAEDEEAVQHSRVDCRNYFRGCLAAVGRAVANTAGGHLETELRAAQAVQKFVKRHFYLCLKESLRNSNPLISRYVWRVNGVAFRLWLPRTLVRQERRAWLEQHVGDVDLSNPLEHERIQDIIDRWFGVPRLLSLTGLETVLSSSDYGEDVSDEITADKGKQVSLKEFIADEKAESIDLQRPAIRRLGKTVLKALVGVIMHNFESDKKSDAEIGREFGLTLPTYSRFAGRDWWKKEADNASLVIPDFYLNLASILARTPAFVQLAKRARVLDEAKKALEHGAKPRLRRTDHE